MRVGRPGRRRRLPRLRIMSVVGAVMTAETSKREAVRLAKEQLGDVGPAELAAFIGKNFGLAVEPTIVAVLLGSLREDGALDLNAARARQIGESQEEVSAVPRRR